jgi:hypothetical protein
MEVTPLSERTVCHSRQRFQNGEASRGCKMKVSIFSASSCRSGASGRNFRATLCLSPLYSVITGTPQCCKYVAAVCSSVDLRVNSSSCYPQQVQSFITADFRSYLTQGAVEHFRISEMPIKSYAPRFIRPHLRKINLLNPMPSAKLSTSDNASVELYSHGENIYLISV